ncbi:hypothetical protein [Aquabacterium sp.]|uniref:hypothetical protein n=1 Tax=Aquabacterium sp. TaxID=1872578 RepID=UPI0019C91925|nr:hypothetical protein [Aquabacterium sp.]MBC7699079.1 hypothetical protein [Aquabacterium sp.]
MKTTFKFTMALAIWLSVGTAIAAPTETFLSGTGTLNFQDNYLRRGGILWISTTPKLINPGSLPANTASYDRDTRVVSLAYDGATVSAADGKVTFSAANSHVELFFGMTREDNDGNPLSTLYRVIALDNIAVDLGNASVYANVSSYYGTGEDFPIYADFGRLAVFKSMAPIANGTQGLIVNGQASGSTAADLMLTSAAADIVINGLYRLAGEPPVDPQSTLYKGVMSALWGSASASGTFASPVPEASTQALIVVGLLPLLAFSRRTRRSASGPHW